MASSSGGVSGSPIVRAFRRSAQMGSASQQPDSDEDDDDVQIIDDGNEHISDVESDGESDGDDAGSADQSEQAGRKRRLQHVVDNRSKARVVQWMVQSFEQEGRKGLCAKAIKQFPQQFRGSDKANLGKASDWWSKRETILKVSRVNPRSVRHRQRNIRRSISTKARPGRGPKRAPWVEWLHKELLEEFERLRAVGLQFSNQVLVALAKDIINKSESLFNKDYIDSTDNKKIVDKVDFRWVQIFMERHNIVIRKGCGKRLPSPAKIEYIERTVAFHLGELQRGFQSGELDEDSMENVDETHFIIDMNNGMSLGFSGDECVKFADVVSGGEGMTMIVRITGGKHAEIAAPFMIFQNKDRNYPIRGCADDVPGVSYRTQPKGWTDRQLFAQYFTEKRAHVTRHAGERVIYLDNCGGHNETEELLDRLEKMKAFLRFFPENATDLVQPADSFVIAKIKDYWRAQWNLKKLELIRNNDWQDRVRADGSWSGKLPHPGKHFFLKLAAESVRAVNQQRDSNGLTYARKAMIRCGLALDVDGNWNETQLFPNLQGIIRKYRAHFDGDPVPVPGSTDAQDPDL